MIETVLKNAALTIAQNVPAVSTSGGAVQLVSLRDGKRVRNVPAVLSDDTSDSSPYRAMLPDDSQSAVAFWQVLRTEIDARRGATAQAAPMIARCRLVVWGNKKRLSPPNVQAVLAECATHLFAADLSEDWITSINVSLLNFEPRDKSIFSEYGFDEVEAQYLTEPYDFASALFDVQYTVLLTCAPEVSAVETAC